MDIAGLLGRGRICLRAPFRQEQEVLECLVELACRGGGVRDQAALLEDVMARQTLGGTAIEAGVAVPHAKSSAVESPRLAVVTLEHGMDLGALDGKPSDLFFLIAAPEDEELHIEILAKLSSLLLHPEFLAQLRQAKTEDDFLDVVRRFEGDSEPESHREDRRPLVLAVTACPTGIAHTYLAARALELAGKQLGIAVKVETQGAGGTQNKLTREDIAGCAGVVVAADRDVDLSRFAGVPMVRVSASEGIHEAQELLRRAVGGQAPICNGEDVLPMHEGIEQAGRKVYRQLMNGVSHMLPFVIGGGILIALAFLLDDPTLGYTDFGSNTPVSAWLRTIGNAAFDFMLPIMAGFIAVAIADSPGLMVGFVGGALAASGASLTSPAGTEAPAGFLGAIVAGFAGGYLMLGLRKLLDRCIPKTLQGVKPILLYPVAGLLMVGLFMCLVNPVVAAVNTALYSSLRSLGAMSRVALGAMLAAMMAVDMGGPCNKAAYLFGTSTLAALTVGEESDVMAAVMVGGMVPPLAIALATTFFKNRFTDEECRAGGVNYILGLCFITEGAVPYAAGDPLRVLPACILGSAVAGGLSMWFGCALPAPHGGIFLFPVMRNPAWYALSLGAGSLVGMVLLALLKKQKKWPWRRGITEDVPHPCESR